VTCGGNKKKHTFCSEGLKTRDRLGDVGLYGGMILKRILEKWGVKV
jgi:hypothetical protein